MITKIVFTELTPQTPGYLKRLKKGLEYRAKIAGKEPAPETIDDMVEFLIEYIEEPADPDEAREAMMNANEEQFNYVIDMITGTEEEEGEENPTVDGKPSTKSEPSETDKKP